ncbi:MAG: hypothetical protein ACOCXP_04330 [Candidatus Dojkabacteria bacterium]
MKKKNKSKKKLLLKQLRRLNDYRVALVTLSFIAAISIIVTWQLSAETGGTLADNQLLVVEFDRTVPETTLEDELNNAGTKTGQVTRLSSNRLQISLDNKISEANQADLINGVNERGDVASVVLYETKPVSIIDRYLLPTIPPISLVVLFGAVISVFTYRKDIWLGMLHFLRVVSVQIVFVVATIALGISLSQIGIISLNYQLFKLIIIVWLSALLIHLFVLMSMQTESTNQRNLTK